MMRNREYTVSVSNVFTAVSPEDAVAQMAAWLDDDAYQAGYRVHDHAAGTSVFIDADTIDLDALNTGVPAHEGNGS